MSRVHFVVERLSLTEGWIIEATFASREEARWYVLARPTCKRARVRQA